MLPAADCGRLLEYEPATPWFRDDEFGLIDPATEKPPVESEPWWWPLVVKAASEPAGRENPLPS